MITKAVIRIAIQLWFDFDSDTSKWSKLWSDCS